VRAAAPRALHAYAARIAAGRRQGRMALCASREAAVTPRDNEWRRQRQPVAKPRRHRAARPIPSTRDVNSNESPAPPAEDEVHVGLCEAATAETSGRLRRFICAEDARSVTVAAYSQYARAAQRRSARGTGA